MSTFPKNRFLFCLCWWPFDGRNNVNPWWLIVWRLPFWCVFQVLRFFTAIVVGVGWGPRAGISLWRDIG